MVARGRNLDLTGHSEPPSKPVVSFKKCCHQSPSELITNSIVVTYPVRRRRRPILEMWRIPSKITAKVQNAAGGDSERPWQVNAFTRNVLRLDRPMHSVIVFLGELDP